MVQAGQSGTYWDINDPNDSKWVTVSSLRASVSLQEAEAKIGCGQIEEVIIQAENELVLSRSILEWKVASPITIMIPESDPPRPGSPFVRQPLRTSGSGQSKTVQLLASAISRLQWTKS